MSKETYYFPTIIGNDALRNIAQLSKQTLGDGEKIAEIFQKNRNLLYGKSSKDIYLFIKQNNQSIFDLSPNSLVVGKQQKKPSYHIRKSSEDLSTPVRRHAPLPRRHFSDGDTTKEDSEYKASETETAFIRQVRIFSPRNTPKTVQPIVDVTDVTDEVFISPNTSKVKEFIGTSDPKTEESICLSSTVDESAIVDQNFISPNASKRVKIADAANEESPRSAPASKMLSGLNVDDCKYFEFINSSILPKAPPGNVQKTDSPGQHVENIKNKYALEQSICDVEESLKIPNLNTEEKSTPSPVKKAKFSCTNDGGSPIQVLISPAEQVGMNANPDENTEVAGVSLKGYNLNISPIERSKTITNSDEKRKSPSPGNIKLLFKKIPRLICSDGKLELEVHWSCELKEDSSPTTPSTLSTDIRVCKTAKTDLSDVRSTKDCSEWDVSDDSNVEKSPKKLHPILSPSENITYACSSKSVTDARSPLEEKVYLKKISPSAILTKSFMSPKALEHGVTPLEQKTSTVSSKSLSQTNNPTVDLDHTLRNRISPSARPSEDIPAEMLRYQLNPREKKNYSNKQQKIVKTASPLSKSNIPKADIHHTPRKTISPSTRPSQELISLKTFQCQFSPTEKETCINTPQKDIETTSHSRQISPSNISCETESHFDSKMTCENIDRSDTNVLIFFRDKLNRLISMRDKCMDNIFESFSEFQTELKFLFLYVKKLLCLVEKIPTEGHEYVTDEFKTVMAKLTSIAPKLAEKLNSWKTAGDSEILTWFNCIEEIKRLKSQNETFIQTDASPVESISVLRAYEKDLKSVWKKMYDLKLIEDARRSSLSKTIHDFEVLSKHLVRCLIIIGILKIRSNT